MHKRIKNLTWVSEARHALSGRTEQPERLAIEMYARGLSMRYIERAFTGTDGRCVLSRSAASQVAERLWDDYKDTRTTNLGERLSGEERRRTKVIPHAFGERTVLKLMYAALIRASQTWRRLVISEFELKQLEDLCIELDAEFKERHQPEKRTSSLSRFFHQAEDLTV